MTRPGKKALAALLAAALSIAGCSGEGDEAAGEPVPAPPPPPAIGNVTLSGVVTFALVPSVPGLGLDYAHTAVRPARAVTVELVSGGAVLASTVTDQNGAYSFSVAQNLEVSLRARAEMIRSGSPGWDFRVVDNTANDALYVLGGTLFNTGTASATRNLHAASGWGGAGYTAARSAAPFAILDVAYEAAQLVLTAEQDTSFPALRLYWSSANVPALGAGGEPDPDTGEIGGSFFARGSQGVAPGIFLLGAADDDTDEYDRHVIAHEWGHYLEAMFSRSDNIGGRHAFGDQLDLRVAFGEGWGNAFAAMVAGPVYSDVAGSKQAHGFAFDIEGPLYPGRSNPSPGWYSEESVQELLYDLFDAQQDAAGGGGALDTVALGFTPIYAVLTGQQRSSTALTSVYPLLEALRADRLAEAPQIGVLAAGQSIAPAADAYGSAESNFGVPASPDLQTVYDALAVGGAAARVCSLDAFESSVTGSTNKLGSRRFLRVDVQSDGPHTFRARAVAPLNGRADPDLLLHRRGVIAMADGAPAAACTAAAPQHCTETLSRSLTTGDYVLEVYEWTNTNSAGDSSPPIGRTCFDVTATSP